MLTMKFCMVKNWPNRSGINMRMENAGRHAESKKTRAIDSPKRPIKNRNNSFGNWSWNGRLYGDVCRIRHPQLNLLMP
jgi:hypothetical protein